MIKPEVEYTLSVKQEKYPKDKDMGRFSDYPRIPAQAGFGQGDDPVPVPVEISTRQKTRVKKFTEAWVHKDLVSHLRLYLFGRTPSSALLLELKSAAIKWLKEHGLDEQNDEWILHNVVHAISLAFDTNKTMIHAVQKLNLKHVKSNIRVLEAFSAGKPLDERNWFFRFFGIAKPTNLWSNLA